jgi:hypothetical protein
MLSKFSVGQLCGFLFLFILFTSILSKATAGTPLDPDNVSESFQNTLGSSKKFRISIVLDLISHVSIIALAGALYLAFSPYNQPLASIGTLWRVVEGTIIAFSEISGLIFLALSQQFVSAAGTEVVALESLGRVLILAEDWGLKIGLIFLGFGSLLYGILFVTSESVPGVLGWWGIIASALAIGGILLSLINPEIKMVGILFLIPYEIVLGIWLLFRGGQIGELLFY